MHLRLVVVALLFFCGSCFGAKNKTTKTPPLMKRVIGGYQSTVSEIGGFIVAIFIGGNFLCGGSYISSVFVVTAAHCLQDRMERLGELEVVAGISSLEEKSEKVGVQKAVMHKKYNQVSVNMDVALLKLDKPLVGKNIKPIRLCTQDLKAGDKLKVSGWGFSTTDEDTQEVMKQVHTVEVPLIDFQKCKDAYKGVTHITKSMICAGVLGKKDACTFDSGGPLTIKGELCGIVSFGVGCADPVYPGVYTDVRYVTPWIRQTLHEMN